jgi:two-component system, response regulator
MSERLRRLAAFPTPVLLLADPDPAFVAMARDALRERAAAVELRTVGSGPALLAELAAREAPAPALVVASCDLPGEPGGCEVVRAVKCNEAVRRLPVVVLGPDDRREAVAAAYDAGANTYIAKPATFLDLVRLMKTFTAYWLDAAQLPAAREAA